MKHFELVEKAFVGKNCSIEFSKFMGRREITIRVDDFSCRSDIGFGFVQQEITDENVERIIQDMIIKIKREFDRASSNKDLLVNKRRSDYER